MPELLEFLQNFDEAFRSRNRLASLYSDFRFQKSSNPDGYQANCSTWLRALIAGTKAGLIPSPSPGNGHSIFVLHSGDALARALQTQEYGRPLALGGAIEDAVRRKELIQVKEFMDAKQSVYAKSWIPTPWEVVSWTLRQLGVVGGADAGDGRVVAADFVVMANVEAAAKAVLDTANSIAVSNTSRIFTKELFASTFASAIGSESLSVTDLDVLLKHLSRDRSAISYSPKSGVVKIKSTSEASPAPITDEDESIAKLRALISSLSSQIQHLSTQVSQLDAKVRESVSNKQLITAKSALRSKKAIENKLQQRNATLSSLEDVYAKIEQAADQVEIVQVMQSSSQTLKNLNKQTGGVERVQDVMDGLREEMMNADEIGTAINEVSAGQVDEAEVEDELEALEKAEREKREGAERKERERIEAKEAEETRKKLEELDKMVEAGTPPDEAEKEDMKPAEENHKAPVSEMGT